MINKKEFGDWAVVFWKKGSRTLHIAQNQGEPNTTNYWMVGTTTRQFDYESGWLPNKEWTSAIKGHFPKDKAIQIAKGNAVKETKGLKESTETLKQFKVLYHGSKNGELRKDEKHSYNCLYVTPVFAYAAMYSTDSDSTHGCVFEMKPVRDLNIFDANDEGALDKLKAKVEELNPENTLVRRIKWEDLKTKDWSSVCFKQDEVRDKLLLESVKALGYDGYINTEWDEDCAEWYARGLGGCGKVVNTTSIGIFDEDLLEIVDEKYFEDYSDDELFNECHRADEDLFITFLQDEGFDDYYYNDEDEAKKWAANNLLFLDVDEVNDLVDEYASYSDRDDDWDNEEDEDCNDEEEN